jgi:hypothetical protein
VRVEFLHVYCLQGHEYRQKYDEEKRRASRRISQRV